MSGYILLGEQMSKKTRKSVSITDFAMITPLILGFATILTLPIIGFYTLLFGLNNTHLLSFLTITCIIVFQVIIIYILKRRASRWS